jgi:uroporphyrinogen III methyltransferase/synthase
VRSESALHDPGPLAGRTIVVTRAEPRARGLVEALQRAGAETIEMPLTTQTGPADGGAALRAAAADVGSYDWVVLTSANAVNRFMGELRDARSWQRPWWPPSVRRQPTRCASGGWSPTWSRPRAGPRA